MATWLIKLQCKYLTLYVLKNHQNDVHVHMLLVKQGIDTSHLANEQRAMKEHTNLPVFM